MADSKKKEESKYRDGDRDEDRKNQGREKHYYRPKGRRKHTGIWYEEFAVEGLEVDHELILGELAVDNNIY